MSGSFLDGRVTLRGGTFHRGRGFFLSLLPFLSISCQPADSARVSRLHSMLSEILAERRIVEPRLTGGSAYSPCRQEPKPATFIVLQQCSPVPREVLARLSVQLEPSPAVGSSEAMVLEMIRDEAIFRLMIGNSNSARQAVAKLEEAIRRRPRDATLFSDLAAARIILAGCSGEPEELVRSMDASERALNLAPRLAAARFNRALALERLFLARQAMAAWNQYLQVDPDSPWSQEAEQRTRALARVSWDEEWKRQRSELEAAAIRGDRRRVDFLVDANRQPVREAALEDWLPGWADAWEHHRVEDAARLLTIARAAGDALARFSGDAMIQDSVAAITAGDAELRSQLAAGLLAYRDGRSLYMEMKFDRAEPFLRHASRSLLRRGCPISGWAELFAVVCVCFRSDYGVARDQLESLHLRPGLQRYPILEGRILYTKGIIRTIQADLSGGLAAYLRARSFYSRTGELENLAAIRHVIAENLSLLGQTSEAWKQRYLALSVVDRIPNSTRRSSLLFEATEACLRQGHSALALALQRELLASVNGWGGGMMRPAALLKKSRIALSLGRRTEAQNDLEEAERGAIAITDRGVKEDLEADARSLHAQLLSPLDPHAAEAEIRKALKYYQRVGARLPLVVARQELARLHEAQGDRKAAELDLRAGIEEYEAQRAGLVRDSERLSFFEQSRSLFDETITLKVRLGKAEEALTYAERSRARALLDQVSLLPGTLVDAGALLAAESSPLSAEELRLRLPPSVVVVEYRWLNDRLFVWATTADGVTFREISIERDHLERLLERFCLVLKQYDQREAVRTQAEHLFDLLLAPVRTTFEKRRRLVIVPDGLLFGLPFVALVERGSPHFVVQDYEIVIAPSATVYQRCTERDRQLRRNLKNQVLAVGNPSVAGAFLSVGGPLPAAETEAAVVASLYPRSVLLTGGEATPIRFLSLLDQSEIVHFAGHAQVNEAYPLLSFLLLAPEGGREGSGPLFAHQIYSRHLRHTRVVVLAACSTGRGGLKLAEEAIGLARPFLAAGAPTVIASLSSVQDAPTLQLLTAFHRQYLRNPDPVAAFQEAQRDRIESDGKEQAPWNWAGFEVFGGTFLPN